jgi:ParB family chromosome partitioning protein
MDTATKRRALGRGLGALIPGAAGDAQSAAAVTVPLAAIRPNPLQPRQTFREEAVAELAESIRQKGVLQPLLVRRIDAETYELIAGERRLRAAERAGLTHVPISVRDASDDEMLELALIENIQREDLNPLEEARAYKRLMSELNMTQQELSARVGKDRSTIANTVRLLQLPSKILAQIESGEISAGHARALAGAGSDSVKLALARRIVSRGLSVRQTEKLARARANDGEGDQDVKATEHSLTEALGTRVKLQSKRGGRGTIEIEYYSLDQLNGLIDRLLSA